MRLQQKKPLRNARALTKYLEYRLSSTTNLHIIWSTYPYSVTLSHSGTIHTTKIIIIIYVIISRTTSYTCSIQIYNYQLRMYIFLFHL